MATEQNIRTKVVSSKSKTSLIIPFVYSKDFQQIEDTLCHSWMVNNEHIERKNILEHVSNLVAANPEEMTKGTIGQYFEFKKEAREKYGLPKNESNNFYLINKKEQEIACFKIHKVSLYLFETNVGLLVYDIKHNSDKVDNIILTNYNLKHLNHLFQSHLYTQKEYFQVKNNNERSFQDLPNDMRTLSDITANMLNDLDVQTYFTNSKNGPETALVYNFMILDKTLLREWNSQEKLKLALFKLRKGYKDSYKPNPNEFDTENNPETLQLFENSFWGVSLEGLTNLVHLTDDDVTNDFFTSNYAGNLEVSYFYIYILALHQRYAFLKLNALASEISRGEEEAIIEKESVTIIPKLRKDINFLILRGFFKHVSSVSHQQKLYEVIAKNLSIEELKEDLHFELEALAAIVELQESKRQKEMEALYQQSEKDQFDQREKNADRFLAVSTVFVVLSTITGSWAILVDFFEKSNRPPLAFPAPYALLILSVLLSSIGVWGYRYISAKWKIDRTSK